MRDEFSKNFPNAKSKIVDLNPDENGSFSFSNFSNFKMPKFNFKIAAAIFAGLVFVLILADGLVSVPAGSVAVVFDRGRGVLPKALPEGLHLKLPFWQKTTILSTRMQTFTMSTNLSAGDLQNNYLARGKSFSVQKVAQIAETSEGNAIYSLTKDGQKVSVDLSVQFHLSAESAPTIFQKIGENYLDKIVRPSTRSAVRETITGFESKELFTFETRQKAELKIEETLKNIFAKNKIALDDVLVRNVAFSDVYLRAIEEKQIAEQKIQKAEFERQEAEKIKERKIIEAQAEAEAIRLKGETLRANPQVIQLEFVQKMAPEINWGILPDGALPLIDLNNLKK
jgi:regulator of protease activity HflC (stomatin/prohibitin superfamily)